ncbi:hypothetical protein ACIBK8_14495 [Streptomyces sp. NPDC050161]|uniref:hypothetical protein n=1 Tax=Streptomyces sp. NPDC050161 TaxID=3365604 RepID=UPI0037A5C113
MASDAAVIKQAGRDLNEHHHHHYYAGGPDPDAPKAAETGPSVYARRRRWAGFTTVGACLVLVTAAVLSDHAKMLSDVSAVAGATAMAAALVYFWFLACDVNAQQALSVEQWRRPLREARTPQSFVVALICSWWDEARAKRASSAGKQS